MVGACACAPSTKDLFYAVYGGWLAAYGMRGRRVKTECKVHPTALAPPFCAYPAPTVQCNLGYNSLCAEPIRDSCTNDDQHIYECARCDMGLRQVVLQVRLPYVRTVRDGWVRNGECGLPACRDPIILVVPPVALATACVSPRLQPGLLSPMHHAHTPVKGSHSLQRFLGGHAWTSLRVRLVR